jgi:hypothetical protein
VLSVMEAATVNGGGTTVQWTYRNQDRRHPTVSGWAGPTMLRLLCARGSVTACVYRVFPPPREATAGDQRVGWGASKGGHRRVLRLSFVIHMNESFRKGQKQNIHTCMHTYITTHPFFLLPATASFSPELFHTGEVLHISAFDPRRELTKDTVLTRVLPHHNPSPRNYFGDAPP